MKILDDSKETTAVAASIIREGGVVAFKTDTLYGLGVDPLNSAAVQRLKQVKGRDDRKPILVLISDESQLSRFTTPGSLTFEKAIMAFWPGPLTIVTRARPGVPIEITAGTETIGLRLPIVDSVRDFIRQCGGALTATSANLAGKQPSRNVFELMNQFPEGIDLIVDSGEVTATEPSTVLDITSSPVRLIREGVISRNTIQGVFDLA